MYRGVVGGDGGEGRLSEPSTNYIQTNRQNVFQENIELVKEVQDLKVNIENVVYLKSQLAGQLEDARRRLEDDERVRT